MSTKLKTGKLSKEEIQILNRSLSTHTDEEIAKMINRSVRRVTRYRSEQARSTSIDWFDKAGISKDLKNKYFWKEVKQQLTEEELEAFEARWIVLIAQFDDVKPTDEMQMVDYIRLEILSNRILVQEKESLQEISRIRKQLVVLEELDFGDADRDDDKIITLRAQLNAAIATMGQRDRALKNMQEDKNKLFEALKATRDKRYKQLEESKTTFFDLLKSLDDKDFRESEGRRVELVRIAMEKAVDDLSKYTTYDDGSVDRPLLNSDSVAREEEEQDETE